MTANSPITRVPALRLGALLVALLAGTARAGGAACCDDPERFPYEALPESGSVELTIDGRSPTFEFQTGISAFRAFRLPAADHPHLVTVRSFISGGPDPARARVFYPLVAVLNDDYLISRLTDLGQLQVDLPLYEAASRPAYRIALPVGEARERYLVIFTPAGIGGSDEEAPVDTPDAARELAHQAHVGAARGGTLRITVEALDGGPASPP